MISSGVALEGTQVFRLMMTVFEWTDNSDSNIGEVDMLVQAELPEIREAFLATCLLAQQWSVDFSPKNMVRLRLRLRHRSEMERNVHLWRSVMYQ